MLLHLALSSRLLQNGRSVKVKRDDKEKWNDPTSSL
jgi:hypothetical protein